MYSVYHTVLSPGWCGITTGYFIMGICFTLYIIFMIDFSSFDTMLLLVKLTILYVYNVFICRNGDLSPGVVRGLLPVIFYGYMLYIEAIRGLPGFIISERFNK